MIFPARVDWVARESPDWSPSHTVFIFLNSSTTSQEVRGNGLGSDGGLEPILTDGLRIPESEVFLMLPPETLQYLWTGRTFPAFNRWVRVTASESVEVNARL